jgi:hypothetical protein
VWVELIGWQLLTSNFTGVLGPIKILVNKGTEPNTVSLIKTTRSVIASTTRDYIALYLVPGRLVYRPIRPVFFRTT